MVDWISTGNDVAVQPFSHKLLEIQRSLMEGVHSPPCEREGGELPSYNSVVESLVRTELPPRYVPGEEARESQCEPTRRATTLYKEQLEKFKVHMQHDDKGIHCTETAVQSVEDVENFFQSNTVATEMKLVIHCYHYKFDEKLLKTKSFVIQPVSMAEEAPITDFIIEHELGEYVKGDGTITLDQMENTGKRPSVPHKDTAFRKKNECPKVKEVFEEYFHSKAAVKDVKMYRKLAWNLKYIHRQVSRIAKLAGYPYHVDVFVCMKSPRVCLSNRNTPTASFLSRSSCLSKTISALSILGVVAVPLLYHGMRKSWSCLKCVYELSLSENEAVEMLSQRILEEIANWKQGTFGLLVQRRMRPYDL